MTVKEMVNQFDEVAAKYGGKDRRRKFTSLLHAFADSIREEDAVICENHVRQSIDELAVHQNHACAREIRAKKGSAS